jgi:glycosyltransferase involved in cell wall biosynthesis
VTAPLVSIIVPIRNEERYIERCLYSIAAQDYARDLIEVIVVDGMSDDMTRQIVGRFAAETPMELRLLDNPALLPAAAMNIGIADARGSVIMRLDGHAALAPDYVRLCVSALADGGVDCAGGALISEGDTYLGGAIAAAMSSRFGVGGAAFRTGGAGPVDTVAFGAYRRDVFARIGGFTEDIERGEDDELNYRLLDAGGVIVLVPDARAHYVVRGDLAGLMRQYFGYGRAKPQVLRLHPAQGRPRQYVPVTFVIALATAGALAATGYRRPLAALGTVYTLAATTASLALASQRGWRILPPLPAIFACMHLSYGVGFFTGALGLATVGTRRRTRTDAHQSTEAPG